jgi:putative transcriptional regulator, XRE family, bacteriophage lambda repressor C1 like protein
MISKFGEYIRIVRKRENDSLRDMAKKMGVSAAFLSAMEVGRKNIPLVYVDKIVELYHLNEEEKAKLFEVIQETNDKVSLELSQMNESQKEVTLVFARKIQTADADLIEKLRKILEDD